MDKQYFQNMVTHMFLQATESADDIELKEEQLERFLVFSVIEGNWRVREKKEGAGKEKELEKISLKCPLNSYFYRIPYIDKADLELKTWETACLLMDIKGNSYRFEPIPSLNEFISSFDGGLRKAISLFSLELSPVISTIIIYSDSMSTLLLQVHENTLLVFYSEKSLMGCLDDN